MKYLSSDEIIKRLKDQILKANIRLDDEVSKILEKYSRSNEIVRLLVKNSKISLNEELPLCQDTGIVEFFVELGNKVLLEEDIHSVLNRAVAEIYQESFFRYSVVSDPLFERKNTFSNTPCIVNLEHTLGSNLKVKFLIKGGGSENLTTLKMFEPSASINEIKNFIVEHIKLNGGRACPPLHIGIGIGGTAEKALLLSKKALLRPFKERNKNILYRELEEQLFEELNNLKIGFQGFGIGPSVLSVNIEYFPTHIATLPIAVSVNCYLCRRGVIEF